jgi:DNA recombination protein RmuC
MEFLYLFIGIVVGIAFVWLILRNKSAKLEERLKLTAEQNKENEILLNEERAKVLQLNSSLSSLQSDYSNLQQKLEEQKGELEELQQKFIKEFENLANKIFEEKTTKFSEQSKTNLQEILNPLKERITEFQNKVEETNNASISRNAALREQLHSLKEMNKQMSEDANNLVKALKGDTKAQGNWGEIILQRILEISGLVKNREYIIQESIIAEDGKRFQPDVVVQLPERKNIIIDSKVSLIAYDRYVSSEHEEEKQKEINNHLLSIKAHLKNLSSKNYQNLYKIDSLDFVFMFIPIEGAFALALQNDRQLYDTAFEMNIIIVSPTTLLATLRTIENMWKREYQNRNAFEIAKQSGALYDKFVGFVKDLEDVGDRIDKAKISYEGAYTKLKSGSGNLVKKVEDIKKLGAKASKSLPASIVNRAEEE